MRRPDSDLQLKSCPDLSSVSIEWPTRYGWFAFYWVDSIRAGLSRYVTVRLAEVPQLPNTAVRIHLHYKGEVHDVIIDYSDYPDIIFTEYLQNCLLYFKMQFRKSGYGDPRILPGQYVPSDSTRLYNYLPRLRRIRDASQDEVYNVYGRFGLYRNESVSDDEDEVYRKRSQAIRLLGERDRLLYKGGGKLIELFHSLRDGARSKVCLDLPGRGPFCHRLVDYLSIGACIVAYPHQALLCPPLVSGKHIAYCRPDLSDLVELCDYYITHERERHAMIKASREYFDAHLHKDSIAAYYLESCLGSIRRTGASTVPSRAVAS